MQPPPELPAIRLPVRLTKTEHELVQRAADLSYESKQSLARRVLRAHCMRVLRARGAMP